MDIIETMEFRKKVYDALVEYGPCTARKLTYHIDAPWGELSSHTVAAALVYLKADGKVKVVDSRNDVRTWAVR